MSECGGMSGFQATDWRGPSAAPVVRAPRRRLLLDPATREHGRAAALIDRAKQVVRDQFEALRHGAAVDLPAVQRLTREVARSIERNRYAVIGLTRLRSAHEYTYTHSIAVSALMIGLARELALPPAEVEAAGLAGMLHDIGKAKVPAAVLDKPGPLSPAEWVTVKTHPERGAAILARLGTVDPIVLDVALHHHERLDGSGYPHGLSGEAIGLHARMGAVCDVYDALTSRRAYKEGRPAATALDTMARATGQFDGRLLRALRSLIGAFPAGTLVRLERGQVAVVLDELPADLLAPRVRLVGGEDCETRDNPIVAIERPEDWPDLVDQAVESRG